MQPENNGQNVASMPVETNAVAPKANDDIVFQDKPKKSTAMILCLVFLALLAAGGIGFGVWAMMDGDSQKEQLNEQISALRKQNSELQEQVSNNTEESDVRKSCDGTYYGELKEEQGGAVLDLRYTYTLNEDGTFIADYGGVSKRSGVYTINGNTISLTGNREIGGPEDMVPAYVTEDAIVADDCSYIKLESMNGTYGFELKKQ